jgi:hypothetical protein
MLMQTKHWLARQQALNVSDVHDLMGHASDERSNHQKKCSAMFGCPALGPVTSFLFLRDRLQGFKVESEVPDQRWNDFRHLMMESFSNLCLERIWAR